MDGEYNGCAVIMRGVEWDAAHEVYFPSHTSPHARNHDSDNESPLHLSPHLADPDSDPHVFQRILENRSGLTHRSESSNLPRRESENSLHSSENSINRSESSKSSDSIEGRPDAPGFQIPTIELSDAARYFGVLMRRCSAMNECRAE